ncbi:MAG: hypothetical protein K5871_08035 [Lachnospiraceae bacterium]|nr:hypothetical protein [Lachnospiraceae bacterium]
MYESMIQSSEQTYFEAHQRYLMDKRSTESYYAGKISSAYDEGYDKGYDKGKSELQEVIDRQAEEIARLKEQLEAAK